MGVSAFRQLYAQLPARDFSRSGSRAALRRHVGSSTVHGKPALGVMADR
jgi:hypothetical protein